MKKDFYTPQERYLIEALITHENMIKALELDLMLLEMEAEQNMMDGLTEEALL